MQDLLNQIPLNNDIDTTNNNDGVNSDFTQIKKQKIRWRFLLKPKNLIALIVVILFLAAATVVMIKIAGNKDSQDSRSQASVGDGVKLNIDPPQKKVKVNDSFTMEVVLDAGTDAVSAVILGMLYNPDVLKVSNFKTNNKLPVILSPAQVSPGKIQVTIASNPQKPFKGQGVIASFKVKVLKDQSAQILFTKRSAAAAINSSGEAKSGNSLASKTGTKLINVIPPTPEPTQDPTNDPEPTDEPEPTVEPSIEPTTTLEPTVTTAADSTEPADPAEPADSPILSYELDDEELEKFTSLIVSEEQTVVEQTAVEQAAVEQTIVEQTIEETPEVTQDNGELVEKTGTMLSGELAPLTTSSENELIDPAPTIQNIDYSIVTPSITLSVEKTVNNAEATADNIEEKRISLLDRITNILKNLLGLK